MRFVVYHNIFCSNKKGQKHSSGGIKKNRAQDKHQKKGDLRKAKAHAPTADELDSELAKYMGNEYVAKKLDAELDAYFKAGETENQ